MPSLQTALFQSGLVKTDDPHLHGERRLLERFAELQPEWASKLSLLQKIEFMDKLQAAEFDRARRIKLLEDIIKQLES
jgi:hypothetical protein